MRTSHPYPSVARLDAADFTCVIGREKPRERRAEGRLSRRARARRRAASWKIPLTTTEPSAQSARHARVRPRAPTPTPAVPLPHQVRDDELLIRSRRGGVARESTRGVRRPGANIYLHPTMVRGRVAAPVRDAVPVRRLVQVDAHRLPVPPSRPRRGMRPGCKNKHG